MTIRVNGVEITAGEVNRESAHHEGGPIPERRRRAALALVVRELLRQRADALGIEATGPGAEAEDRRIDVLVEREVAVPEADDAACRRYFLNNPDRFRGPDRVMVRHILLAAAPDDLAGRASARARAESLIRALAEGAADFADLARTCSACPSRAQGGHLGEIARGATVPEFEAALARLPDGLAPRPIETRYGWHVVDVLERDSGPRPQFEVVRERIAGYLAERARRRALGQYVRVLAAGARIEGIDIDAADSPLVQ